MKNPSRNKISRIATYFLMGHNFGRYVNSSVIVVVAAVAPFFHRFELFLRRKMEITLFFIIRESIAFFFCFVFIQTQFHSRLSPKAQPQIFFSFFLSRLCDCEILFYARL